MKLLKIFTLCTIINLFTNCADNKCNEILNQAEALIDVQPDSVLSILKTIDINSITASSQKAKYALIKTHAITKYTGKAITDSIINYSANYYKKHNSNTQNLALSLLYQSNYYINNGLLNNAMLNLLQVEDLLPQIEDDYTKGYHKTLLGALYTYYCDYNNASIAYQDAYKYFENIENAIMWQTLIRLQEGIMYYNISKSYEKSITIICDALKGAEQMKQEPLITLCKSILIVMYTETKQLDKASALINDVKNKKDSELSNNIHIALYSTLAYLFYCQNDFDNSTKFMNLAKEQLKIKNKESVMFINRLTDIAVQKGNYKEAYELALKSKDISIENKLQLLERPLMTTQRDYFKKELEQNKIIQKIERQRNFAIILCLSLIGLGIIIYLRQLNKTKQKKLNEYADIVFELQTTLQENKTVASELIETLYKDQFKILNGISDSFFSHNNDAKGQKIVYNEVKYLIEQFKKDKKTLFELENIVNKCCNNVMQKLREEIPSLDETDYRQFCYHYAGFSGKLISILLDKSQANIYMRKSRLKEKIQQSNTPSKEDILRYLG